MKTSARSLPLAPLALAASLLTAFLVLFAPLSSSAHDVLLSSSPEADGTVETLPEALTLTFSENLITGEGATEVLVTDAAGTAVSTGAAVVDGAVVTQPLVTEAEAGAYHVVWKVVSSDGHPTSGEYDFTVTTSTVVPPTEEPTEQATEQATAEPTPVATADPTAAPTSEEPADSTGLWVLGIVGVLAVAAVVILLLSRRANRSSTDSSSPSER